MAESGEDKLLRGATEEPSGPVISVSNKASKDPRVAGNDKVGESKDGGVAKWHGKRDPWSSNE